MRPRISAILAATALALVAAGCGGDDEQASETVPPLPELTVPGEGTPTLEEIPDSTTGTDADGGSTTPDAGATPPPSGDTGGTPSGGTPSGGQPAPQDSPQNDTPPPANSPAERFEDFCSENPGAC